MLNVIKSWGQRYFSDPQAVLLTLLLVGSIALLMSMGRILAPVLASIVIAYLLQWCANLLIARGVSRSVAVYSIYVVFLGLFLSAIFFIWPIIWAQLLRLHGELPSMVTNMQNFLYLMPQKYPEFLTAQTVDSWIAGFLMQLKDSGKTLLAMSVASLPSVIAVVVYFVLVPLMVFFFLKDNRAINRWMSNFLPNDRQLLNRVYQDVNLQIGNYIRGKVAEMFIVGIISLIVFYLFHLHYAMLLAVLVGLSVLIPYIGAILVTIPVVFVAFFQWGLGPEFFYLMFAYGLIQTLDGILLVPLLFSEMVNLHPLAIIIAVLVFGGWWGFWGVFFAIPLATLVKAIIDAWPRASGVASA